MKKIASLAKRPIAWLLALAMVLSWVPVHWAATTASATEPTGNPGTSFTYDFEDGSNPFVYASKFNYEKTAAVETTAPADMVVDMNGNKVLKLSDRNSSANMATPYGSGYSSARLPVSMGTEAYAGTRPTKVSFKINSGFFTEGDYTAGQGGSLVILPLHNASNYGWSGTAVKLQVNESNSTISLGGVWQAQFKRLTSLSNGNDKVTFTPNTAPENSPWHTITIHYDWSEFNAADGWIVSYLITYNGGSLGTSYWYERVQWQDKTNSSYTGSENVAVDASTAFTVGLAREETSTRFAYVDDIEIQAMDIAAANAYLSEHSDTLALTEETVQPENQAAVSAAIADYVALDANTRSGLAGTRKHLNKLQLAGTNMTVEDFDDGFLIGMYSHGDGYTVDKLRDYPTDMIFVQAGRDQSRNSVLLNRGYNIVTDSDGNSSLQITHKYRTDYWNQMPAYFSSWNYDYRPTAVMFDVDISNAAKDGDADLVMFTPIMNTLDASTAHYDNAGTQTASGLTNRYEQAFSTTLALYMKTDGTISLNTMNFASGGSNYVYNNVDFGPLMKDGSGVSTTQTAASATGYDWANTKTMTVRVDYDWSLYDSVTGTGSFNTAEGSKRVTATTTVYIDGAKVDALTYTTTMLVKYNYMNGFNFGFRTDGNDTANAPQLDNFHIWSEKVAVQGEGTFATGTGEILAPEAGYTTATIDNFRATYAQELSSFSAANYTTLTNAYAQLPQLARESGLGQILKEEIDALELPAFREKYATQLAASTALGQAGFGSAVETLKNAYNNELSAAAKATELGQELLRDIEALEDAYEKAYAWIATGKYTMDFEDGVGLIVDNRYGAVHTGYVHNNGSVYEDTSAIKTNPYGDGNAFEVRTGTDLANGNEGDWWVYTPDVWGVAADNGLTLRYVKMDAEGFFAVDSRFIFYKYESKTNYGAFTVNPGSQSRNYYYNTNNSSQNHFANFNNTPALSTAAAWKYVIIQFDGSLETGYNVVLKAVDELGAEITLNSSHDLAPGEKPYIGFYTHSFYGMYVDNMELYFDSATGNGTDMVVSEFTARYENIISVGNDLSTYPTDSNEIDQINRDIEAFHGDYRLLSALAQQDSDVVAALAAVTALEEKIESDAYGALVEQFKTDYADVLLHISEDLVVSDTWKDDADLATRLAAAKAAFLELPEDARIWEGGQTVAKQLDTLGKYTALEGFKSEYSDVLTHISTDLKVNATWKDDADLADRLAAAKAAFLELPEEVRSWADGMAVAEQLDTLGKYMGYAALVDGGVYTQNFEGENDFAPYASYEGVSKDTVEITGTFEKNGVLTDGSNTGVLSIHNGVSADKAGWGSDDADDYGQFVTVDAALWQAMADGGKHLTSGSFDMFISGGAGNSTNINYKFTDKYNYNFYAMNYGSWMGTSGSTMGARDYYTRGNEQSHANTGFASGNIVHRSYATNPGNKWYHFVFFYDADGKFHIYGFDGDGMLISYEYSLPADAAVTAADMQALAAERILSFGRMNNGTTLVDNITFNFTAGGVSTAAELEAIQLLNDLEVREFLDIDPAKVVPFDAARINVLNTAWNALSADAQAMLPVVDGRMESYNTALAKWDTTSDESVANSFRTITEGMTSARKLNFYNRLTAAQKKLLSTEYAAIIADLAANDTATATTYISCVGDSITYGSGQGSTTSTRNPVATTPSTDSYPAQLQTALNAKFGENAYKVGKYGTPGIRVMRSSNFRQDQSVAGQYRNSVMYYESTFGHYDARHENNTLAGVGPDIVIIMLGTNDISAVKDAYNNGFDYEDILRTGYANLIQSYLALDSNPTVILATVPSKADRDTDLYAGLIAKIQREVAEEFGISMIDMFAITSAWTDAELLERFADDNLHPNVKGYAVMAQEFCDFLAKGEKVVDTAASGVYSFVAAEQAQYTPSVLGATMSTSANRLQFNAQMGYNKTGVEIVEYGTVFTYYDHIGVNLTLEDLVLGNDAKADYLSVATKTGALESHAEFAAKTFSIDPEQYTHRVVARAYVKYADGSVYYSDNTTDGGSIENAKGVENGYCVRSICAVSIAITKTLAKGKADGRTEEFKFNSTLDSYMTWDDTNGYKWGADATGDAGDYAPVVCYLVDNSKEIVAFLKQ